MLKVALKNINHRILLAEIPYYKWWKPFLNPSEVLAYVAVNMWNKEFISKICSEKMAKIHLDFFFRVMWNRIFRINPAINKCFPLAQS